MKIITNLKDDLLNKGVNYVNERVNEGVSIESLYNNLIHKRFFKIFLKENLGVTKRIDTAIVEILIELP